MVQTGRTYEDRPMIRRVSNEEMELKARQEAEAQFSEQQNKPVISALASHIRSALTAAISAKQTVTKRLLACLRQREGIYEADIQSLVKQQNGTNIYMMITDIKCRAIESWLKDIMLPSGERPYSIEPTPVPDIPPGLIRKAQQAFMADYAEGIAQQNGGVFDPRMIDPEDLKAQAEEFQNELLKQIREMAQDDADSLEDQIDDELVEGKWYEALSELIEDFATYPTAFLEGPIFRKRAGLSWVPVEGTIQSQVTVADTIRKEYSALSPFDVYPSPGAKTIQDGDLCIRKQYTRRDLVSFKGVDGFDSAAIDQVLERYGDGGYRESIAYDTEISDLMDRPNEQSDPEGHIDCIKFFGSVQGFKLRQWGMNIDEIPDPFQEYSIIAYLVGSYVIGARLNHHPLGKRHIYSASFRHKNGSIWGKALPECMKDIQSICNSSARAICNNAAIACLTGDTVVFREGQRRGASPITIRDLWNKKSNHNSGLRRIKLRSLDEETGEFFSNRIIDVVDNGVSEIFEIITEKGYKIKSTNNHRFMRDDGQWQELSDFDEGEMIAVNGQVVPIQNTCVECGGPKSPNGLKCRKCASQFHNSKWNQKQALEASNNRDVSPTTARARKQNRMQRKAFCQDCGQKEGTRIRLHNHHIDRDPWNNDPYNLTTICEPCHHQRHAREDSFGDGYLHKYISYDRIKSITYVGMDRVFDLCMTGPNHNFVANGFISHNSGPQIWQLVDLIPPEEDRTNIYPWKIWSFSSEKLKGSARDPMGFHQPILIVNELLAIYKYFFEQASEVTGIPAYVYGNQNVAGAGKTASGLSMLMNAAAKGLRNAAGNIDKGVISPSVEEHWLITMLILPDLAKGDSRIVARASEYLIQQEQLQIRLSEALTATNNPTDMEIIGLDGRSEMLRNYFKGLKMNPDKMVPDREDMIMAKVQTEVQKVVMMLAQALQMDPNALMQILQQGAGNGGNSQGRKPRELDAAGNPVSGQDVRMFNQ